MSFAAEQIEELKRLCPAVALCEEGGTNYFLLPKLTLPKGCEPPQTDALLCPSGRDGYPSRLFLADRIKSGTSPNWQSPVRIVERNWHVYSWRVNSGGLRLTRQAVACRTTA